MSKREEREDAELEALVAQYRTQQQQHSAAAVQCDGAAIAIQNLLDTRRAARKKETGAGQKAAPVESAPKDEVA